MPIVRQHKRFLKVLQRDSEKHLNEYKLLNDDSVEQVKEKHLMHSAENVWIAFTTIVEILAKKESISHANTDEMFDALYEKYKDPELSELARIAEELHKAHYGSYQTRERVVLKIQRAKNLIKNIEGRYELGD